MYPAFELPDRLALYWQLDMGVNGINILAARMAHERLADFLHNSGFHQTYVEGVPKVMEPVIPDACAADGSFPSGLYDPDRMTFECKDRPPGLG